jgi:CRISPR-associated protein Csb2
MLTLAFTFPAGRYHATPWERHVNEGAVVWPPEPWRVLRGLIATWHHKVKPLNKHDEKTLGELVEALSKDLPCYQLPAASHSHTRHYMPQFKAGDTSLVFDAFAAVSRSEPLLMVWQGAKLSDAQQALLDDLLAAMGYLGRAESWVEAARIQESEGVEFQANCVPGNEAVDKETGELRGEVVPLLAPLSSLEYGALRQKHLPEITNKKVDKKAHEKAVKKFGATLPEKLLDALSAETSDLRKLGWSQPPAARRVNYLRPVDALKPRRQTQTAVAPTATTITYLLIGKPLPRVEDSVRIGELLRRAVMSVAKDEIPSVFSGHDLQQDGKHRHAFFLPWDGNDDGRIDRIVLHAPVVDGQGGMGPRERRIVEKVNRLWSRSGSEWRLAVESIGGVEAGGTLLAQATVWQSVTPYLHPWFIKKNLCIEDQIRRECRERGLPEPVKLEMLPSVRVGNQTRTPIHFHRFRSKRGLNQPDRHGSLWRLIFAQPVQGPLALGFACHYGLGLFKPAEAAP